MLSTCVPCRLPQATGSGCFGYDYNPATGKREINQEQAPVIQRIFEEFCGGQSVSAIARGLVESSTPAMRGGRWYPLTVRNVLLNEVYTGKTIYRRTRTRLEHNPATGKRVRRVEQRPTADWIEIPGATPPIVSSALYQRAQVILADPERRLRGRPSRRYALRGRLRCAACGTKMVGQTLAKGRYHYYRCRRAFGQVEGKCTSRYIRLATLEDAVRTAIANLLAEPNRILAEARRLAGTSGSTAKRRRLTTKLIQLEKSQKRLVRLYTRGDVPEHQLDEENRAIAGERAQVEAELSALGSEQPEFDLDAIAASLPDVVTRIRSWIEDADGDDLQLLLQATQAEVTASIDTIEIKGFVPLLPDGGQDPLVTIEQTSA